MQLGAPELLIILVIVVLLFGAGRVGKIAGELGSGIRAFRDGLKSDDEEKPEPAEKKPAAKVKSPEEQPAEVPTPVTGGHKKEQD